MTLALSGNQMAEGLSRLVPNSVEETDVDNVWIRPESILEVCAALKDAPDYKFDYLVSVSAVDYIEYFELVYHLVSMVHNHSAVIKAKCWGRTNLSVPSVVGVWQGADFQEREVYDLKGVSFEGHPNLKRLVLWEGFPGHPQRKDYLEMPR